MHMVVHGRIAHVCTLGLTDGAQVHILWVAMTLSDEITDLEQALRAASVPLDSVIESAGINRSTWTRWKSGSVKGARYDTLARVRQVADAAIQTARRSPKERAA
mgnify:CR=1 FL=1